MSLKERIQQATKDAMRAKDKARLATLRMVNAAIKQREVDERIELNDAQVLAVLEKMLKQRREAAEQYRQAGREELAAREEAEMALIQEFLPEPLSEDELDTLITQAIDETGAQGIRDMGKVMGTLRPKIQGRADMGQVSAKIKARLGA